MSRAIQLRRGSLEDDLNKLEKDYRDVDEKKRFTSNPQEINNLELQLKNIVNDMDKIERELNQLKQLEETKDNTQALLQLLTTFEEEIITCVQRAYHACSPDDWPHPVPDNLTVIFEELGKMPQGTSKYTRIERWVGYLVTDSELPRSVYHQLNEWGNQNIKGYSELLREVDNKPKSTNSYLMVVVQASNQSLVSNPNKEEQYFVDAWFRQNDSVIDCDSLSKPGSFPEAVTADQIPQILQLFLDVSTKYSWRNLTIELFLPLALMNQAVDTWEIDDEFGFPTPIGCHYQVLVRSAERLLQTYSRHKGCWQQKWDFFQQLSQGSACNAFVSGDGQDLKVLFVQLSKNNIIGLKLVKAPLQVGKGSVFAVILKAAIPVALWLRQNLSNNCQKEVDGLLNCCCVHELPEVVKNKRLDHFPTAPDTHIGQHLSLLWEDPKRLPPSIEYSM
ncbi:MAG: hypothetical protein F6K63_31845 [Moorea sp. SIO1G6]|uniref:VMAP-C domain-containing protein n=1 Tax=Moorena sp. SIO1G6 TaxID=2607840 RepID=UPI0013C02FA7|nr:hypothetical protein [Moorena sp. SIO1G6]NET68741.1 hypothetical protein [Moorena sp. SIO1G6]